MREKQTYLWTLKVTTKCFMEMCIFIDLFIVDLLMGIYIIINHDVDGRQFQADILEILPEIVLCRC